MTPGEVFEIGHEAIFTLLKVGAPLLGTALAVGLVVSLFQALTQMQELTLSFVPKVAALALAVFFFLPFMSSTMIVLGERMFERIAGIG